MNARAFLESWSAEFTSRCDRVRHLIGSRHWLSDGRHKEDIIAEHLRKYLGGRWEIASGFIAAAEDEISPEIDIFVLDPAAAPPLLHDGGIRIVAPESVAAFIEVKSTFSKQTLEDVCEHQAKTLRVLRNHEGDCWCGAVFYTRDSNVDAFVEHIARHLAQLRSSGLLTAKRRFCFAILDTCVCLLDDSNAHTSPRLKTFESTSLSVPAAFCDLFSFVSERPSQQGRRTLDALITSIDFGTPKIREIASS